MGESLSSRAKGSSSYLLLGAMEGFCVGINAGGELTAGDQRCHVFLEFCGG